MAVNWTPAQQQVIDARGKTLLVSAAAGSGKTAVLTARIIGRLTEPGSEADISRMLIVTFTKAAAAELKDRISAALREKLAENPTNTRLASQLMKLGRAKISTIHSFCYDVVRANFERLGISASVRVADETEMVILNRDVMDAVVEEYYSMDPARCDIADFPAFCEQFITLQDERLCDIMLELYDKLQVYPEGIDFLLNGETGEEEFFHTSFGRVIRREMGEMLAHYRRIYADALEEFADGDVFEKNYLPAFSADYDYICRLIAALDGSYEDCRAVMSSYSKVTLGRGVKAAMQTPESQFYRDARDSFGKQRAAAQERYFSLTPGQIRSAMAENAAVFADVHRLLSAFRRRLDAEKLERGVVDFTDLERMTYRLFYDEQGELTPTAREMAARFDEIYIDEYQDVNALQDRIFAAVSRPDNRFMVGDIKQSIYGFRGASPDIFAGYRERFLPWEEAGDRPEAAIFLSSNFRCDRPIIDFCNLVCGTAFRRGSTALPYSDRDDLILGKTGGGEVPVEVAVLPAGQEGSDPEVEFVVSRIGQLVAEGVPPGDICILLRSAKGESARFEDALKTLSVPCTSSVSRDFFGNAEVLLMLCLLNCIDNPSRDIYLAGALKSPLYGFTLDDLVRIRRETKGGSLYAALVNYTAANDFAPGRYFLDKLAEYREAARGLPVDRLIWLIYRDSGLLSMVYDRDEGSPGIRRANLMLLYEYARQFEGGSFRGLYKFIQYINSIIESDQTLQTARPAAEGAGAVRIMSIHQSKGLEFPVCFLCGTGRKFNERDAAKSHLFSRETAAVTKLRDPGGFAAYDTPMRRAAAASIRRSGIDEEMRVLYVALTRAKSRLIVTAADKEPEKLLETSAASAKYLSPYAYAQSPTYIGWILSALSAGGQGDFCRLITEGGAIEPPLIDKNEKAGAIEPALEDPQAVRRQLLERFSFVYPHRALTDVPAKLSVSRLFPEVLDQPEEGTAQLEQEVPEMRSLPRFMEESSAPERAGGARRGTATHVFMQFCDLERAAEQGVEKELARLVENQFMTQEMADLCYIGQLKTFFRSSLCEAIRTSRQVWRELRFNIRLPAGEFTADAARREEFADEQILVQGVVDCLFLDREGKLCLVDYKTDYIPPELREDPEAARAMLRQRHRLQLGYYRVACERMMRRPVDRVWLYAFGLGEAFLL